jgi:rubredoxin
MPCRMADQLLWRCQPSGSVLNPARVHAAGDVQRAGGFEDIGAHWSRPVCGAENDHFPLQDDLEV